MSNLLLFPLQVAVLFLLHLAFGFSRLIALVRSVPSLVKNLSFRQLQPSSSSLSADLARWKKIPAHIAVVWSPGSNAFTWQSNKGDLETIELEKLISDAKLLIGWCEEMGVARLSMYDSKGILQRNGEKVIQKLGASFPMLMTKKVFQESRRGCTTFQMALPQLRRSEEVETIEGELDSGCSASDTGDPISTTSSTTLVSPARSSLVPTRLTINLLSRLSGRPHLATIARDLSLGLDSGSIERKNLDRGLIEETIEGSAVSEPDLLLVLGGPHLRLQGFPPWQLRLTEMYHHSSPSWLPAPPISYSILRKALDVYGGAEMRLGR